MRYLFLIISGTFLILFAVSCFVPFVPVWIGGVMGIIIFLCVGTFTTKFIG